MADLPPLEEAHEVDKAKWGAEVLLLAAVLPLSLSLLVGIITFLIGVDADIRYFELAAQIIPVLFLALVIEQRYFFQNVLPSIPASTDGPTPAQMGRMVAKIYEYQAGMFLVLAGGEVAALWAVASVNPSRITFAATTAGLVAGALALVVSSAKGLLTSLGEREIAKKMKSLREELLQEQKDRLEAWRLFLARAEDGVSEAQRPEFEEAGEWGAELVRRTDVYFSTEHFQEELDRLSRRKEQNDLTPGQEMALRLMLRVQATASDSNAERDPPQFIDRMSKTPEFSEGDRIELLEDVGFSPAGAKGTVVEQLEDDVVMIDVKAKRFSPVRRQTALVKPSEIRLRGRRT